MGTSSSSKGPKGGVSFDPPWLDSIVSSLNGSTGVSASAVGAGESVLAPPNRFTEARRNLSAYMRNGRAGSLRRAIGSYVRNGLGGTSRAASRMRVATAAGARVFSLLSETESTERLQFKEKLTALLNSEHTTEDVISAILDFVFPSSGSVDEESCRNAMAEALSDLLLDKPDVDIVNFPEEDIWCLLELFLEKAIVMQVTFDIGQVFESDAISIDTKIRRLEEMERFVQSVVSENLQEVRKRSADISQNNVSGIIRDTVGLTFEVFGGSNE